MSVSTLETTIVELSEFENVVVPVWLVDDSVAVDVFKVDWMLPLPLNSKVVLEFVVNGEPFAFNILLPFVSSIIFLWAESLLRVRLPDILSVSLKNWMGNLLLAVPSLAECIFCFLASIAY